MTRTQEKLKEINLAYDYLKSHRYTPPPDDESSYSQRDNYHTEEEPAEEERAKREEPTTTHTPTPKPASFFSGIPKWVMIAIAIVLIWALFNYFNTPSKPQKTQYKPPVYYPVPSEPSLPAIELPSATEKPKPQKPITKPLTKPPPQTSKVSPRPTQDEALKETEDTSQTSEEDLRFKGALPQPSEKVVTFPSPQLSVSSNYFTIGSSKEEVLAVQGTPDSFTPNEFRYSASYVNFSA